MTAYAANKMIKTTAIVPSAGMGSRMGGVKKNFLKLGTTPILAITLKALDSSPLIDSIIVAVSEDDIEFCKSEIVRNDISAEISRTLFGQYIFVSRNEAVNAYFRAVIFLDKSAGIGGIVGRLAVIESHILLIEVRESAKTAGHCLHSRHADEVVHRAQHLRIVVQELTKPIVGHEFPRFHILRELKIALHIYAVIFDIRLDEFFYLFALEECAGYQRSATFLYLRHRPELLQIDWIRHILALRRIMNEIGCAEIYLVCSFSNILANFLVMKR